MDLWILFKAVIRRDMNLLFILIKNQNVYNFKSLLETFSTIYLIHYIIERHHKSTCFGGFLPDPTQTLGMLYSDKQWLET